MKYFLALSSIVVMILSCGGSDSTGSTAAKEPKEIDGKKIFQKFCVACHGVYGDMAVNGAKDLNLSTLTIDERIEIIANGKNVMTPFKGVLSNEEIKAVAEYTKKAFKQ